MYLTWVTSVYWSVAMLADSEIDTGAEGPEKWFKTWGWTLSFVQAWMHLMERCWTHCHIPKQGDCWTIVRTECDDPIVRIWICWSWGKSTDQDCLLLMFAFVVFVNSVCLCSNGWLKNALIILLVITVYGGWWNTFRKGHGQCFTWKMCAEYIFIMKLCVCSWLSVKLAWVA